MGMCPVEWEGRGSASSSGTELFATLTPDSVTTNFAFHFFLIAASLSSYHLNIIMAMHVQRQVGLRIQHVPAALHVHISWGYCLPISPSWLLYKHWTHKCEVNRLRAESAKKEMLHNKWFILPHTLKKDFLADSVLPGCRELSKNVGLQWVNNFLAA